MREIVFLRHGATAWNRDGRIQGRRDVPLSEAGRRALSCCRVPSCWQDAEWQASPLERARASAEALGARQVLCDERLREMHWGDWEGARLAELRAALGAEMARNEALGIDFRPPGGESPREVRERLRQWVAGQPAHGAAIVAMTHKGVIRAALSLATGWDMRDDFRPRADWTAAHVFRRDRAGTLSLERLNVPLEVSRG